MKISREEFATYERIKERGDLKLFDVAGVVCMCNGKLSRQKAEFITDNYITILTRFGTTWEAYYEDKSV